YVSINRNRLLGLATVPAREHLVAPPLRLLQGGRTPAEGCELQFGRTETEAYGKDKSTRTVICPQIKQKEVPMDQDMNQMRATANAHMRRDMEGGRKWVCQCEECRQI